MSTAITCNHFSGIPLYPADTVFMVRSENSKMASGSNVPRDRAMSADLEFSIVSSLPSKQMIQDGHIVSRSKSFASDRKQSLLRRRHTVHEAARESDSDVEQTQPLDMNDALTFRSRHEELQKVRSIHGTLEDKRTIRNHILAVRAKKKQSAWKQFKENRVKTFNKYRSTIKQQWNDFEIWRGSLKRIEGSFGLSVASYFRFLKWLLFLNITIATIVTAFIIVPQVLLGVDEFHDVMEHTTVTSHSNGSVYLAAAENCTNTYHGVLNKITESQQFTDRLSSLFQGSGWLEHQILFYGYFFNRTAISSKGEVTLLYNMSAAYILSTLAYFFISLLAMVMYTAKGVQQRFAQEGGRYHKYFNQVLCGWNYTLTTAKAADYKHRSIHQNLTNDLEEERLLEWRSALQLKDRIRLYTIRFVVNIIVMFVWVGSGWAIIATLNKTVELSHREDISEGSFVMLIIQFLPSIVLTLLSLVVPIIFQTVVVMENYLPQNKLKITIFRTVFLRLAAVTVLVVSLKQQITGCSHMVCGSCPENVGYCWETFVGQQFYRLAVLDLMVVIFVTVGVELPRKLLLTRFHENRLFQFIGVQEFAIPKNVLDLVYTQTICWLGTFYSPLIPVITVCKLLIFFYVKKMSLFHFCVLPNKPFRSSASTFFMVILMFSFILCVIPVFYSIGRITPSQSCGVFRVHSINHYTMWQSILDIIAHWPDPMRELAYFFGSWTFYIPAAVVVCLFIYYYIAVVAGNRRLVKLLKEQLLLSGRDKQFLMGQIHATVGKGGEC